MDMTGFIGSNAPNSSIFWLKLDNTCFDGLNPDNTLET